jgi:hypothetical protein
VSADFVNKQQQRDEIPDLQFLWYMVCQTRS